MGKEEKRDDSGIDAAVTTIRSRMLSDRNCLAPEVLVVGVELLALEGEGKREGSPLCAADTTNWKRKISGIGVSLKSDRSAIETHLWNREACP